MKIKKMNILSDGTNDHYVELEFSSKEDAEAFMKFILNCEDIDKDLEEIVD